MVSFSYYYIPSLALIIFLIFYKLFCAISQIQPGRHKISWSSFVVMCHNLFTSDTKCTLVSPDSDPYINNCWNTYKKVLKKTNFWNSAFNNWYLAYDTMTLRQAINVDDDNDDDYDMSYDGWRRTSNQASWSSTGSVAWRSMMLQNVASC